MAIKGFTKRSGSTYTCKVCQHLTRATQDPSAKYVGLCDFCYEVAGEENALQDGCITEEDFNAFVAEQAKLFKISPERLAKAGF